MAAKSRPFFGARAATKNGASFVEMFVPMGRLSNKWGEVARAWFGMHKLVIVKVNRYNGNIHCGEQKMRTVAHRTK